MATVLSWVRAFVSRVTKVGRIVHPTHAAEKLRHGWGAQDRLDREGERASRNRARLLSVAVHGCLLALLFTGISHSALVVPYRLPGTAKGDTLLVYFSPGSLRPVASEVSKPVQRKAAAVKEVSKLPPPTQPKSAEPVIAKAGVGTATESGLGEGDVKIALETYFPYPKPDLSVLPHGTRGDVILDAVIDEHGKISELTLLHGLGTPVDESVIATVKQWTYTPAMKNGVPVASERELHFHYERG